MKETARPGPELRDLLETPTPAPARPQIGAPLLRIERLEKTFADGMRAVKGVRGSVS